MFMLVFLLTAHLLSVNHAPTPTQPSGPIYFAVFEGTCLQLVLAGVPSSKKCASVLMVSKFKSKRAAFLFQQVAGNVVAFRGILTSPKTGEFAIDEVEVAPVQTTRATGTCVFLLDEHSAGQLDCHAKSIDGATYSASFAVARAKSVLGQDW